MYYQDSPQWAGWQALNFSGDGERPEVSKIARAQAKRFDAEFEDGSLKLLKSTAVKQKGRPDIPLLIYTAEIKRQTADPYFHGKMLFVPFTAEDSLYTDMPLVVRDEIAKLYGLEHLRGSKDNTKE